MGERLQAQVVHRRKQEAGTRNPTVTTRRAGGGIAARLDRQRSRDLCRKKDRDIEKLKQGIRRPQSSTSRPEGPKCRRKSFPTTASGGGRHSALRGKLAPMKTGYHDDTQRGWGSGGSTPHSMRPPEHGRGRGDRAEEVGVPEVNRSMRPIMGLGER